MTDVFAAGSGKTESFATGLDGRSFTAHATSLLATRGERLGLRANLNVCRGTSLAKRRCRAVFEHFTDLAEVAPQPRRREFGSSLKLPLVSSLFKKKGL